VPRERSRPSAAVAQTVIGPSRCAAARDGRYGFSTGRPAAGSLEFDRGRDPDRVVRACNRGARAGSKYSARRKVQRGVDREWSCPVRRARDCRPGEHSRGAAFTQRPRALEEPELVREKGLDRGNGRRTTARHPQRRQTPRSTPVSRVQSFQSDPGRSGLPYVNVLSGLLRAIASFGTPKGRSVCVGPLPRGQGQEIHRCSPSNRARQRGD
jgi:hypothetical protein